MVRFIATILLPFIASTFTVAGAARLVQPGGRRLMQQSRGSQAPVASRDDNSVPLTGCTYRVRGNDTLASVASGLNIDMDTLQFFNLPNDTTDPSFFSSRNGVDIYIPCPGTTYKRFFPLQEAGCFFDYTINITRYPTLLKLATEPPISQPGPITLTGIWTANAQSLGIDITKPGVFTNGRFIYLPTCGHSGTVTLKDTLRPQPRNGCSFKPQSYKPTPSSDSTLSVSQLATRLGTNPGTLQKFNPNLSLKDNTAIHVQGSSGGSITSSITIPCPGTY